MMLLRHLRLSIFCTKGYMIMAISVTSLRFLEQDNNKVLYTSRIMQTYLLSRLNDNQRPWRTIIFIRILIPEGCSYMANLSATDSKRLENTFVGTLVLAGCTGHMADFEDPNFQDTSAAPPEIYEGTAQARIFLVSSASLTMGFRHSSASLSPS